ncbi:hypothetical protein RYX45_03810 [Alkalihalophilus pseudofirmus]|uniref:Uncharacterized protein n=1 Tax=Alkalihalophilus pseudofirmus TaxID=79885 RepID=A0AAJ2KSX2_ALKPS|nr:hypothetical protein [Alkalihalophilus pseudofirmus]MDV2884291.1 hypothetical protein [Alkalihalophilus pseudofirmus]WEG18311.1 hypothetical protein PQ478_07465 [Alkalihalophilus pseudofirmus]
MDPYFIFKKCLLLLTAYGGILTAFKLFPHPRGFGLGELIGAVLFSPFQMLAASFAFVAGFLAYSLFVQDLLKTLFQMPRYSVNHNIRILFLVLAFLSIAHLMYTSWVPALCALILASLYGIMDVNLQKVD